MVGLVGLTGFGCAKGEGIPSGVSSFSVGDGSATMTTAAADDASGGETAIPENCGDGSVEDPEECDGDELNGESCASQGFSGGQLRCSEACNFDTSMCSDSCGNGTLDPGEQCDGTELSGDCTSVGFVGGTISCAPDCTFDTSECSQAVCGDGELQEGESCDCGMMGACTPAQLGNTTCMNLPAPSGGNYSGGTLGCMAGACTYVETGCFACGNGVLDMGEQCDGANLAGATCGSQGFDAGSLACSASCTFNTGACINYVCGNASCEPGEDSCSCLADCPDDPTSCANPCECGFQGGPNCFCDDLCLMYGDCCNGGPC